MSSEPTSSASELDHDAPGALAKASARLRAVLALATLAMFALSWPLWIESEAFPRVPFLRSISSFPPLLAWGLFGLNVVGLIAVASGKLWRVALLGTLAGFLVLILQDQHRFQPWAYQYLVVGTLLASLPRDRSLTWIRWWYISVYLHSGLSKLDVSFVHELGSLFLQTAARPLRLNPQAWSPAIQTWATLAMPIGEILIALALAIPATRRWGVVAAVALHATLIGILGPLGLRHSTIVLIWNAAMMLEVPIAFGVAAASPAPGFEPRKMALHERLVLGLFVLALGLPLVERWGWFDAWPSHALYASHVGRTEIYLHESDAQEWPEAIRKHVRPSNLESWWRFDLTGWSREVRGVPVYPQSRACNGLAEALAARYRGRLIRVIQWGPADRWTGTRSRTEHFGFEAIQKLGDRFLLNAHPAGTFLLGSLVANDGKSSSGQ